MLRMNIKTLLTCWLIVCRFRLDSLLAISKCSITLQQNHSTHRFNGFSERILTVRIFHISTEIKTHYSIFIVSCVCFFSINVNSLELGWKSSSISNRFCQLFFVYYITLWISCWVYAEPKWHSNLSVVSKRRERENKKIEQWTLVSKMKLAKLYNWAAFSLVEEFCFSLTTELISKFVRIVFFSLFSSTFDWLTLFPPTSHNQKKN